MIAGSEPDAILTTIYDGDIGDVDMDDWPSAPSTVRKPNLSTQELKVSEATRNRTAETGIRFVESGDYTTETIAMPQIARMAYKHTGATMPDDLRRGLMLTQFPTMIKVGPQDGTWTDPHATAVDTGIVPFHIETGSPDGLMVYRPMSRTGDPLVPIIFTFRGSGNLWDAWTDYQLNNTPNTPVAIYETLLSTHLTYITNYLSNTNTANNYRLVGHSLGGKLAADVLMELMIADHATIPMRCDGCYCINPFLPADLRFRQMYSAMSSKRQIDDDGTAETLRQRLRTHLKSHIISDDFASKNLVLTPMGNVNVYGGNGTTDIITDDSWQQLSLTAVLTNGQHSIVNFAINNPDEIMDGFPELDEGTSIIIDSVHKEILSQFAGITGEQSLSIYRHSDVLYNTPETKYRMFTSNINVQSTEPERFQWKITGGECQYSTVLKINNNLYLNVPINLWSNCVQGISHTDDPQHIVRVIPTPEAGEFLIEEIFPEISEALTPSQLGKTRIWTAPYTVWKDSHLPLELAPQDLPTIGTGRVTGYTATNQMTFNKARWTINIFTDPGHRRDLSNPMWQLQANDGTEFVIQQSDYPQFDMEQRDNRVDASGVEHSGYENASLLLYQSNTQVSNTSGIKWTCTYTSSSDSYEFINVMDPMVKLGYKNSWYVTGSGNTNMNLITNTELSLTSTGTEDEYTITQVIGADLTPAGVNVTMASIHHDLSYETIGGVSTVTGVPMTWFEFPNMVHAKFTMRPYDEHLDNGVPIYVPPSLPADQFEQVTLP